MKNRSSATAALALPGGKWTAHDLRRTAATLMAKIGVSNDVINECLNHKQADRMTRVYVQDRREAEQAIAFDKLGARLRELCSGQRQSNVVVLPARHQTNVASLSAS
jgi:integrase